MGMCDPLLFVSRHCTVCLFVCSRHRVPPQRHSLLTVWIPKQESAQQREGIWVSPGNNGSISQNLWSTYLSNTDGNELHQLHKWFISRKRTFLTRINLSAPNLQTTERENTKKKREAEEKTPVELRIGGLSFDGKLPWRLQIDDLAGGLSRSLNRDWGRPSNFLKKIQIQGRVELFK